MTDLVQPSPLYLERYGADFELMFRISAKRAIQNIEVRGPTVFKKSKDVEYTIFLPFAVIMSHADAPRRAIDFLLNGVCEVFDALEISSAKLLGSRDAIRDGLCADPAMLHPPSWDEAENNTDVRRAFELFFGQTGQGPD